MSMRQLRPLLPKGDGVALIWLSKAFASETTFELPFKSKCPPLQCTWTLIPGAMSMQMILRTPYACMAIFACTMQAIQLGVLLKETPRRLLQSTLHNKNGCYSQQITSNHQSAAQLSAALHSLLCDMSLTCFNPSLSNLSKITH